MVVRQGMAIFVVGLVLGMGVDECRGSRERNESGAEFDLRPESAADHRANVEIKHCSQGRGRAAQPAA